MKPNLFWLFLLLSAQIGVYGETNASSPPVAVVTGADCLKDVDSVKVMVNVSGELPSGISIDTITNMCEAKLREAKIHIQSDGDPKPKNLSVLSISISLVHGPANVPVSAIDIDMRSEQAAVLFSPSLMKNNSMALVTAWNAKDGLLLAGDAQSNSAIRDTVSDDIIQFVNDYLKANPNPYSLMTPKQRFDEFQRQVDSK